MTPEQVRGRLAGTWITGPLGRVIAAAEIPEWLDALAPVVVEMCQEAAAAEAVVRLCNAIEAIARGDAEPDPGYLSPAFTDPAMHRGGAP